MNLYKVWLFVKKDFIIQSSYKMAFFLGILEAMLPIVSLYFVGKLVKEVDITSLEKYGGKYFPFAFIGVTFVAFFQMSLNTFSGSIRRAQYSGCFEAILSSQTEPKYIVIMSSVYSFLSAGLKLVVTFLIAVVLFGFDFSQANFFSTVATIIISLFVFISLGIIAAAGTIFFKEGEPIGWFLGLMSFLLSGAMFPITVMPKWLQFIASLSPITYSLDALRLAILKNYSLAMLNNQLVTLLWIAILLFPLSLFIFDWTIRKGKKDGTLVMY